MTYLFATNVISDLVTQTPKVRHRLVLMSPADRAVVCTVVIGEVNLALSDCRRVSDGQTWIAATRRSLPS